MTIDFTGRVAIVTGAARGLGRSHALGLAARGAAVVINDLGRDGHPSDGAQGVAAEIIAGGGRAIANGADVADEVAVAAMVEQALAAFGKIDILVNNAGILRDKSFSKMTLDEWDLIIRVHLRGTAVCTKAVWDLMRAQNYGRIAFTSSASGIYGNFGQANYGAAKAAMVGLMNVLHQEGMKNDIRVNTLVPSAATAMTENLLPPPALALLEPAYVTPALLYLVSADAPSRLIMDAGAGNYAITKLIESEGLFLAEADRTPETIAARFAEIADMTRGGEVSGATEQTQRFVGRAMG